MGTIIKASCQCGFRTEELFVGPGFMAIEQRCRDVHGNAFADTFDGERDPQDGCPVCGGPVEVVSDVGGPCPRCGAELQIVETGLWD